MRRSFAAAGFPLVVGLVACATGTPSVELDPVSAEVDANPVAAGIRAESESIPLSWFADNWGPFDPARVGTDGSRQLPLVLIDGEQVYRRSLMDVDAPVDMPTREDIRHIRIVKGHSGAGLFGEAACSGIIMVFTHDYDGPMPITRKLADPPDCRRGTR